MNTYCREMQNKELSFIQNRVKHLRWSVFEKLVNGFFGRQLFLQNTSYYMFGRVLDTPVISPLYNFSELRQKCPNSVSFFSYWKRNSKGKMLNKAKRVETINALIKWIF